MLFSLSASQTRVIAFLAPFLLCAFYATRGMGAGIMAVSQDEGYSGKVLDRIMRKWKPPPQLKGDYRLNIVIGVDGEGRMLECRARKPSGLKALDVSACAAVKAASPFGPPPYGVPSELYLAFWTGTPGGRTPVTSDPLPDFSDAVSVGRSEDARERARLAAEAIAKSTGKTLPGMGKDAKKEEKAAPAKTAKAQAPRKKAEKPKKPGGNATVPEKIPTGGSAPVTEEAKKDVSVAQLKETSGESAQAAKKNASGESAATPKKDAPSQKDAREAKTGKADVSQSPPQKPREAVPAEPVKPAARNTIIHGTGEHSLAQEKYDPRYQRYLDKATWDLRNAMVVPIEAPAGTYHATLRLKISSSGRILESSIISGSGDEFIDRYMLAGVRRAGRIGRPPAGLGDYIDLTFTMVRK